MDEFYYDMLATMVRQGRLHLAWAYEVIHLVPDELGPGVSLPSLLLTTLNLSTEWVTDSKNETKQKKQE
jgi:hypothetical protein